MKLIFEGPKSASWLSNCEMKVYNATYPMCGKTGSMPSVLVLLFPFIRIRNFFNCNCNWIKCNIIFFVWFDQFMWLIQFASNLINCPLNTLKKLKKCSTAQAAAWISLANFSPKKLPFWISFDSRVEPELMVQSWMPQCMSNLFFF